MKIEKIIEAQQSTIHNRIKNKYKRKRRRGKEKENLSFNDCLNMMKHHSYYRAKGGALRQK